MKPVEEAKSAPAGATKPAPQQAESAPLPSSLACAGPQGETTPICSGCDEPMQRVSYRCGSCGTFVGPSAPIAPASPPPVEQCICAAIRLPNGEVWRGHRHDNCIRVASQAPDTTVGEIQDAEQGFITSLNRFVDREEGAEIQRRAGIVSAHTMQPVSGMLFSEDLYLRDWRSPTPPAPRSGGSDT